MAVLVALADPALAPEELETLTTLADINKVLSDTVSRGRTIELELEGLLSKRSNLERSMSHLQASTREVC